jgi:hypothetical protein
MDRPAEVRYTDAVGRAGRALRQSARGPTGQQRAGQDTGCPPQEPPPWQRPDQQPRQVIEPLPVHDRSPCRSEGQQHRPFLVGRFTRSTSAASGTIVPSPKAARTDGATTDRHARA